MIERYRVSRDILKCLFDIAFLNPSILSQEYAFKFKFCMNSSSNEVIIDHKDAVSYCGDGVCLLDRKIILLLELKRSNQYLQIFYFRIWICFKIIGSF